MAEKFVSGDFIGKRLFAGRKTSVFKTTLGKTVLFTADPGVDLGAVKALVRGSKAVNGKAVPDSKYYFAVKLSDGKTGYINFLDGDFTSFKAQGVRTDRQKGSEDKSDAEKANETFSDKLFTNIRNIILIAGGVYIAKEVLVAKISK